MAYGRLAWLFRCLVMLSFVLLALGLYTQQPPYFMAFALLAVIAYAAHQTGPHIKNAARAAIAGDKVAGSVNVEVTRWSDSDTFYATVAMPSSGTWRFKFIPLGWTPIEGEHPATLFRLPGITWPALIQVQQGVFYPRETPKLLAR